MRLVPYGLVAVSHNSCGFESGAWQSFFVFNFNNNHGFVEVLCALRLVTPPVGNDLEITSLNLAPRVVFITPVGSLFSRCPRVASRISLYDLEITSGNERLIHLLASQQFKQTSRPPIRFTLYENIRVLDDN